MASLEQRGPEQVLVDYLLGTLPEDETEKLDQLSIEDDEFSWRLAATENDLVDAYVRGELTGSTTERFQAHYLATPRRHAKVRFAGLLAKAPGQTAVTPVRRGVTWRWALALAASFLAIASGFLAYENWGLRQQLAQERSFKPNLERVREASPVVERAAAPEARPRALAIAAFVLAPQTRGAGGLPVLRVPTETDVAAIDLDLETDDFPVYEAVLHSLDTGKVAWRSARVHSRVRGQGRSVNVQVPAGFLQPDRYSLALTGFAADGKPERVADYTFRIVSR